MYAYDVEVHRSIRMSALSIALMQAVPGLDTVILKCTNIAIDDSMSSSILFKL